VACMAFSSLSDPALVAGHYSRSRLPQGDGQHRISGV